MKTNLLVVVNFRSSVDSSARHECSDHWFIVSPSLFLPWVTRGRWPVVANGQSMSVWPIDFQVVQMFLCSLLLFLVWAADKSEFSFTVPSVAWYLVKFILRLAVKFPTRNCVRFWVCLGIPVFTNNKQTNNTIQRTTDKQPFGHETDRQTYEKTWTDIVCFTCGPSGKYLSQILFAPRVCSSPLPHSSINWYGERGIVNDYVPVRSGYWVVKRAFIDFRASGGVDTYGVRRIDLYL